MNRKKWQGLTCALLASLMMTSVFANAEPKPVASPKQIQTNETVPQKQNTSSQYPIQGQSITPIQSVTPNKEAVPKQQAAPTQSAMPKQTAPQKKNTSSQYPTEGQSITPIQSVTPNKEATPKQTAPAQSTAPKEATTQGKMTMPAKIDQKDAKLIKKPDASKQSVKPQKQETKCITPKKHAASKVEEKKPFTLDHFKMIVCTLKQLGMQESQIANHIKQGKKLEDILKAEKISPKKFKKCIIKQYNKAIDEGVKEGQITKEQCKQLKAAIKETVKNWLPQDK